MCVCVCLDVCLCEGRGADRVICGAAASTDKRHSLMMTEGPVG